jgi:hypothetical protein
MTLKFKTKEEARAFLRKVMGPEKRILEGKEREHVLLMLAFTTPDAVSNNQHSWSEVYKRGSKHWCVTTFPDGEIIVEDILDETDT